MTMTTDGYNSAYQSITIKYCLSGTKFRMLNPAGCSLWDLKPSTVGFSLDICRVLGFVRGHRVLNPRSRRGGHSPWGHLLLLQKQIVLFTITRLDMYGLGKCK